MIAINSSRTYAQKYCSNYHMQAMQPRRKEKARSECSITYSERRNTIFYSLDNVVNIRHLIITSIIHIIAQTIPSIQYAIYCTAKFKIKRRASLKTQNLLGIPELSNTFSCLHSLNAKGQSFLNSR